VLRAAAETEATKNIQDWLELDEGDPGFQFLAGAEIAAVILLYLFSSALTFLLNFPFICFISIFCLLGVSFSSLIRISEGLL
jgi:hypothetical protein